MPLKPLVDLSYWQDPRNINYYLLAQSISGAILRVSYGSKYDYPYGKETAFPTHYGELTSRNVPLGAYFFLTQYQPVVNQVRTLVEAIEGKVFPLGIWLDVELEKDAAPLRKQTVQEFMQRAEAELGYAIGIYTSKYYWSIIMGGAYFTTRKLWVAHYGVQYPLLPEGWISHWLHQYAGSATGRIAGYPYGIDLNRFNGTQEEFDAWVNGDELIPQPPPPPLTKLGYPCDKEEGYITQYFGENPQNYPVSRGHNGIDFGFNGRIGLPIYAAEEGRVEVSREDVGGYGRHIRIRHSHGITIYGHLHTRLVQVGDRITKGQQIGTSGGNKDDPFCGYSTGPHLHFEYRWDIPAPQVPGGFVYNAVDPLPLLENEQEDVPMLYQIEIVCTALNIRSGPGVGYAWKGVTYKGDVHSVYEERDNWCRIGTNRWVSGYPVYVKKLEAPDPTLAERVSALEARVTALEQE